MKKKYFKLFAASFCLCLGSGLAALTSCAKQQTNEIKLSWVNNKSTLDQNNVTIQAIATMDIYGSINPIIDTWNYDPLPTYITASIYNNSIIFMLDSSVSTQAININVYAEYHNVKSNKIVFNVNQYTAIDYDWNISLSASVNELNQSNKTLILTATISPLKSLLGTSDYVDWTIDSLPGFINQPSPTTNTNSLTFTLKDNEETFAGQYVIKASYDKTNGSTPTNCAAPKEFILKTVDWEYWDPTWIPLNDLNISRTTLLGLKQSVNISAYTILHIPRRIKTISNSAFENNQFATTIENIDFSASNVENIGANAFKCPHDITSKLQGKLILPNSLKTLGVYAFLETGFSDIDTNACYQLLRIPYGCFAECNNITAIEFNNNLQTFEEPDQMAPGAFENPNSNSKFNGVLTLPTSLKTIGARTFYGLGNGSRLSLSNKIELMWLNCNQLTTIGGLAFSTFRFDPAIPLVIPSTVTTIGQTAFASAKLKNLFLPNNINRMGPNAFSDSSINTVTISKSDDIYPYVCDNEPLDSSIANFGKWLRGTDIEPKYNTASTNGAKVIVPTSRLAQYKSSWPTWITIVDN